jgi:ubiquitin C
VNDEQHLLILASGRRLRDAQSLDMYPICHGATIYLVRRDPKMLVEILTLTGLSCWILTGASEPIGYIKSKIQEQEGIPPDQQRLIFAGKRMNNKRTVSAYKIQNGCTIFLTLRLRGGGGSDYCRYLTVNLPSGHSIGVPLDGTDTIYELKLWVQNSEGISVDKQIMMFEEKELMDFVPISDCERMDFDLLLRDV